jgi:hypothetical protein
VLLLGISNGKAMDYVLQQAVCRVLVGRLGERPSTPGNREASHEVLTVQFRTAGCFHYVCCDILLLMVR